MNTKKTIGNVHDNGEDDLDNYINTFKLKTFEDSDSDDDIFSSKQKPIKPVEQDASEVFKTKTTPIKSSPVVNVVNVVNEDNFVKVEKTDKGNLPTSQVKENIHTKASPFNQKIIPPVRVVPKANTFKPSATVDNSSSNSSFKNISDDYKNIFTKKIEIFTNDVLEHEINKIGAEEDSYEIVNLENQVQGRKNNFEIDSNNSSSFSNSNNNIEYSNSISINTSNIYKEEKEEESHIINTSPMKENFQNQSLYGHGPQKELSFRSELEYKLQTEFDEVHKYENLMKGKFDKGKLILTNCKNTQGRLAFLPISNIISKSDNLNKQLEKDYFPITYSEKFNSSIKLSLSKIKSRIENKEIKSVSQEEYLLISLLFSFIDNNFTCSLLDSGAISHSKRKELITHIKKLKFFSSDKNTNRIFNLEQENSPVNSSINTIFDKGLERMLAECYNEKSGFNLLFFSLFGKREDIYMYISSIFEENPHYKDDDLYILFMIKSGKVSQLVREKGDVLFKKLYHILLMLIQNFEYFEDINVNLFFKQLQETDSQYNTLDKSLILSILTNKFTFRNSTAYSEKISNFLNFSTYSKLLFSDFYNYISFLQLKESDDDKLTSIGFCSILIKYKYIIQQIEGGNYNKEMREYAQKVYENIKQFGLYSTNQYFREYMKDILIGGKENVQGEEKQTMRRIENAPVKRDKIFDTEERKEMIVQPVNSTKLENVFKIEHKIQPIQPIQKMKTEQKTQNISHSKNQEEEENKGGIGSFLINALGFGPNRPRSEQEKPKPKQIVEEEKPSEEKVPEVYYDPQKRRWVLRGKIYDDDDSNRQTSNTSNEMQNNNLNSTESKPIMNPPPMRKVMNPPPKVNIPTMTTVNTVNTMNKPTPQIQQPEKQTTIPEKSNKIANPFAAVKRDSVQASAVVKPPSKPNLTNRYTSIIDYDN